jgi:methanogenic corrinoid protein MtbC1
VRGQEPRVQPPALDASSDIPLYNTKAVVHQTGVPAPTLRAWERRYGILTPRRGDNDYRLYSERDIVTVTWLRERVQTGMTISQAIALLKSLEPARRRTRRVARSAHLAYADEGAGTEHGNGNGARAHAASAPVVGRFALEELHAHLLHQLVNFDEFAASRTIAQTMAVFAVEDVCTQVLAPVLAEIGRLWAAGALSIATEHFASAVVRAQLESLFRAAGSVEQSPLVFVGCAPGELHEIGALMLALFLRRAGLHVAYLGQSVEAESLAETVVDTRPAAVLLSAASWPQVAALVAVGKLLSELTTPRPLFGFGGQAFAADAGLAAQVPGLFLGASAEDAVRELKRRLSAS